MSIIIKDFVKETSWNDDGSFFFISNDKLNNSKILIEYLNEIPNEDIDEDIRILEEFNQVVKTNDKKITENYIMRSLDGFTEYEDGLYVFITGATDMSPSVLYDIKEDLTFLIHPNFGSKEKFIISAIDLISLLKQKKGLIELSQSQ